LPATVLVLDLIQLDVMRQQILSVAKTLLLKDLTMSADELRQQLRADHGIAISTLLAATISSNFREDLKFLAEEGVIKIDLTPPPRMPPIVRKPLWPIKRKPFKPWWFNG
jgi:hypothetical protein